MQTSDYSDLPGVGMSYTDLCNTDQDSDARLNWRALSDLAQVNGLPVYTNTIGARTKTVDELLADLIDALPAGTDLRAAIAATVLLTDYFTRHQHSTVYEVRILRGNGPKGPHWEAVREANTPEEAKDLMVELQARHPESAYLITEVRTNTETTILN